MSPLGGHRLGYADNQFRWIADGQFFQKTFHWMDGISGWWLWCLSRFPSSQSVGVPAIRSATTDRHWFSHGFDHFLTNFILQTGKICRLYNQISNNHWQPCNTNTRQTKTIWDLQSFEDRKIGSLDRLDWISRDWRVGIRWKFWSDMLLHCRPTRLECASGGRLTWFRRQLSTRLPRYDRLVPCRRSDSCETVRHSDPVGVDATIRQPSPAWHLSASSLKV